MSNVVDQTLTSQTATPWPVVARRYVTYPELTEDRLLIGSLRYFGRYVSYVATNTWRLQRGDYKVSGVLSRDGVVFQGKVLLLERRSLLVVAETKSGPDGSFLFEHLPDGEYMLLARDGATLNDRPDFNATVIDYVHPEPMV